MLCRRRSHNTCKKAATCRLETTSDNCGRHDGLRREDVPHATRVAEARRPSAAIGQPLFGLRCRPRPRPIKSGPPTNRASPLQLVSRRSEKKKEASVAGPDGTKRASSLATQLSQWWSRGENRGDEKANGMFSSGAAMAASLRTIRRSRSRLATDDCRPARRDWGGPEHSPTRDSPLSRSATAPSRIGLRRASPPALGMGRCAGRGRARLRGSATRPQRPSDDRCARRSGA